MTPVADAFMSGQRPRYIGPELRGPADADGFRVKVGRYGDRWYYDPLLGDHIAPAWGNTVPSVSTVKKASGNDWSFTALERVAKALDTEKYRNLARWPYPDRYEALKAINKIGLNSAGQRGSNVHLGFDARLHGAPCPISDDMPGADYRNAIDQFFTHYNPTLVAAEFVCIHRTLNGVGYGGTADAIIEIDGIGSQRMRFIVDWKSRGIDSDHGAYPEEAAQVSGYHGADYIIVEGRDGPERRLMPALDGGLIVSVKPDGCRVYPVDLDKGFQHWSALHAWWVARRDEREPVGRQWPARKTVEGEGGESTPRQDHPGHRTPSPSTPARKIVEGGGGACLSAAVDPARHDHTAPSTLDVEGAGATVRDAPDSSPSATPSPQAAQSPATVNAGRVGPVADRPAPPPVDQIWVDVTLPPIDDPLAYQISGKAQFLVDKAEALAWASQLAPAPLPALPDHPDEGKTDVGPFANLKDAYENLNTQARKWITTLTTQASQANVSFRTYGRHTMRRYWIIRGLVTLTEGGNWDDDVLRALCVAALDNGAPLDVRHTPGHCVGSLDAAAAQRFATLAAEYVGTSV